MAHAVSSTNSKKKTSKTPTNTKSTRRLRTMNIADLFKKNIIFIPIVASLVVGSFTSIRYVLNLTQTINESETQIVNLQRDLDAAQKELTKMHEKFITALLAILLALGGWTLQRTFSLSQDMVLIKTKVEIIEDEIQNFKANKGKKKRKKKNKQDN